MDIAIQDILRFQKNELTSAYIYEYFAKRLKDKKNQKVMAQMAKEEAEHAQVWQKYTHTELKPHYFKAFLYILLIYIFGYTFMMKLLEHEEYSGIKGMQKLVKKYPHITQIIAQEEEHEKHLIGMLDEDRLNYVGDMVLGLNDALVELTGTLAGLTFVLMNATLIAMAGIITGVSATLSMVASNYLAQRANDNPKAFKASIYTGVAYIITVLFLVLPYLIFPSDMYLLSLAMMIVAVISIIACFNYYVSVIRSEKFLPRFLEMSAISLSVALIAFLIGLLANQVFHLDIQ